MRVRSIGAAVPFVLDLDVGGVPPSLPLPANARLTVADGPTLAVALARERRSYHVFVPAGAPLACQRVVTLTSPTTVTPPDPRALGVRLDAIALRWTQPGWVMPSPHLLLVQVLALLLLAVIARTLGLPALYGGGLLTGLGVGLVLITGAFVLEAWIWELRIMVILAILGVLARITRPYMERTVAPLMPRATYHRFLTLALITMLPPLLGVLFPDFGSHDQGIHVERLAAVRMGQRLLIDNLAEFQGRPALTPITYYLLVVPASFVVKHWGVLLDGFATLVQSTSGLVLALAMLRRGAAPRAGMLALVVLAGMPLQFTILWWGFGPQIVGQWLLLVLALLLAPAESTRAGWAGIASVLTLALLMHNGVALLGGL